MEGHDITVSGSPKEKRAMKKYNTVRLFESRKASLDTRIKRDYVRNGIVTIPCKISDYGDVISPYSVKDFETLNPEFVDYVKEASELTPEQYPLVLNIIEDCLTEGERTTIEEVILDDFAYDLGVVEKQVSRHTKVFLLMLVGLILFGIVLWLTEALAEEPREVLFILFWFMGDTLCDYIFLTGHDLRRERRLAGRLASIKVVFSESFEEPRYTDSDYHRLYSEIEDDVKRTIREHKGRA